MKTAFKLIKFFGIIFLVVFVLPEIIGAGRTISFKVQGALSEIGEGLGQFSWIANQEDLQRIFNGDFSISTIGDLFSSLIDKTGGFYSYISDSFASILG